MRKLSPNARGSVYMVLASLGYTINDGFVRRTTEEGPGVYQVLFMRSVALAVVFLVAGRLRGEHTRRRHFDRPLTVRVAAEVVSSAMLFAGLVRMEFANAQSIIQIVPFAVTLVAAAFLGERVSRAQYLAVALGFLGVLIIVRPATDGFTAWSLVLLGSAGLQVVREFATKGVPATTPALSIAFTTAVGLAGLTFVLSLFDGWGRFSPVAAFYLALSISCLIVGYLSAIETVRVGDLSVSAPFRYSAILGAVVVGYLMFDEVPDALTLIGALVIIAGGLWSIRLERSSTTESVPA